MSQVFSLSMKLDNAAFDDAGDRAHEVAAILRKAAGQVVEDLERVISLHDSNGNTVGTCGIEDRLEVTSFTGPYRFLSNFSPAVVTFENNEWPTVEHAYQAAKTDDDRQRARILAAETPGQAKKLGRSVDIRADWESIKVGIMLNLLMQKFSSDERAAQLAATGIAKLIEGNTWGGTFWGVCKGRGKNMLGRLLMFVRELNVQ